MRRICLLMLAALVLGGCIERTITITSEPSGALVYLNDTEVGRTPVTVPFTFYGVYDVRMEKDGFETLTTQADANGPWWENPGPDLIAEALPGRNQVDLKFHYQLQPLAPVSPEGLIDRARQLRAIATPNTPAAPTAGQAPAAAPAAPAPGADKPVAPTTNDAVKSPIEPQPTTPGAPNAPAPQPK